MHLETIHPSRSVVFDLDGTLIDSFPGIAASLSTAFIAAGRTMPRADLRKALGPPIRVIAARIDPTLTDAQLAQIETTYRAEYDTDGWRETVLFDGVSSSLQAMRTDTTRLFIVTNKPQIPTGKILAHLRLTDLFEEIVSRDSRTPGYSSKSEMLRALLDRHGLQPESTVMVGDTAEDEEAAGANCLPFIYAAYGYGSISAPRCPIKSFSELETALSTKNPGRRA